MKSIGIILAGGNNNRIGRLSDKRAIAALPVAGSYRAIDFTLSNMSNSRVSKVAVLPQFNGWATCFLHDTNRCFRVTVFKNDFTNFI